MSNAFVLSAMFVKMSSSMQNGIEPALLGRAAHIRPEADLE